jgi:putative tricarboxylic transport membrane protein
MRGLIRAPQNFVSGLALVALAAFAVWAVRNLSQGTLTSIGPAMLPRWIAVGIGLCGAILVITSFIEEGAPLERWSVRGPLFVCLGMLAFAIGIGSFGFLVAAPLAMFICGLGSNEVRWKELLIFALALTAFCIGLFRYALNQPIPVLMVPGLSIEL